MFVVLLTGGLASGKNTVSTLLAELGATVLDTDVIAKEAQEEDVVLNRLKSTFGDDIVAETGMLDRRILAERAFADPAMTDKLNAICWPPVQARLADYILKSSCQPMEAGDLLVIQVPLLAEAPDFLDMADEVISVSADADIRLERAIARGMSAEDAKRRIALQATDEQRAAISDTIFDNNGTEEQLKRQVRAWYNDRIESRMF